MPMGWDVGLIAVLGGMSKLADLSGRRFGRLVAVERVGTRLGHPEWRCRCDCGSECVVTSNALRKGTQSCGCLRREFLKLGPMRASLPMCRPRAVEVTYPVPANLHSNPFVNEVMRRRYQFRWERVEFEVRQIERGNWKEPKRVPFVPRDDHGRPIIPLDLRGMMRDRAAERRAQVEDTPASWNTGSSLADRVRVLTPEEWGRL
jgi:hypothetical protein